MNQRVNKRAIVDLFRNDSCLIINRLLIHKMGLVRAVYFSTVLTLIRQKGQEEWALITEKEITEYTSLTGYLQRQARQSLKEFGFLQTRKSKNQRLYKINIQSMINLLYNENMILEDEAVFPEKSISIPEAKAIVNPKVVSRARARMRVKSIIEDNTRIELNENLPGFEPVYNDLVQNTKNTKIAWTPTLFFNTWNSVSKKYKFRKCSFLDNTLARKINLRLREYTSKDVSKFFEMISSNNWLHIQTWFSLDWCVKDSSNMRKIIEGHYDQRSTGTTQGLGTTKNNQWLELARDKSRRRSE